MEKCGKTKTKTKRKRENADSKKKKRKRKQTNKHVKERNLSLSRCHIWLQARHEQNALSIVSTGYSSFFFFLNSLKHVMPFINITEIITLRSSSLEPLSKYTCIRLSQKRAGRQKNNFGKYLIKNRIFLILVLNIKLFPFKVYRRIIHCGWARGLIVNNPVYPCLPQEYCIPSIPLFSKNPTSGLLSMLHSDWLS